jgi:transcriptional regulator with XRE-family HTH domain
MFSKRLKQLLEKHNLSAAELARKTGIPKSTVQSWLVTGQPSIDHLDKMASYFNMSIDELVFNRKPKSPAEELFNEVFIHSGTYRVQVTRLVKKDEEE